MINTATPVIQLYLNEHADMHPNFRLSRTTMNSLIQFMQTGEHGWGCTLEVLVFVYWLAHGLSYRVTANVFAMPSQRFAFMSTR